MTFITQTIDSLSPLPEQQLKFYLYDIERGNPFVLNRVTMSTLEVSPQSLQAQTESIFNKFVVYLKPPERNALPQQLKDQGWKDCLDAYSLLVSGDDLIDADEHQKLAHETNIPKALALLKDLCESPHVGQTLCAIIHYTLGRFGFLNNDPEAAIKHLKLAAKGDFTKAIAELALYYDTGTLVKQNYPKALTYYKIATKRNHAAAQNNLGYLHEHGLGIPQNLAKAFKYYQLAAQNGDLMALHNLNYWYQEGIFVEKNLRVAFDYAKRAADKGSPSALTTVGYHYLRGVEVEKNPQEAVRCYEAAAKLGHPNAHYNLGNLYHEGVHLPKDLRRALMHFEQYVPNFPDDQSAFSFVQFLINDASHNNTPFNRSAYIKGLKSESTDWLILQLKVKIQAARIYKAPLEKKIFDYLESITRIREVLASLCAFLDQPVELFDRDDLTDIIYSLSWVKTKLFSLDLSKKEDPTVIENSFIEDILTPKKKVKKQPPKKPNNGAKKKPLKKPPKAKQAETPKIDIPQAPTATPVTIPAVTTPTPKRPQKIKPIEPTEEERINEIINTSKKKLAELKQREKAMHLFYLKNCDGQVRKLMGALFDKADMTIIEVNKLIEHLAKTYKGEARTGSRTGGMLILKIGDLTTGGHAPHGGKTDVDKGALADLRQFLANLYVRIRD